MSTIYIRTYAYNAEKTLNRAVDSILNQSYENFIYYLCDNGSTDNTKKIIEEYAERDSRIRPFYNKINQNYMETKDCLYLPHHIEEDDYFCVLDADDEYCPDFLENMLSFMNAYELEIAACGSDFIDTAHNNQNLGQRLLSNNMIIQGKGFRELFPLYHVYMRTSWGKMFKGLTLRATTQNPDDDPSYPAYGGDTYSSIQAFSQANRIGILAMSLHKYYIYPHSRSYTFNPKNVEADQIIHEKTMDYLLRFGPMSRENNDFIFAVYTNALWDTTQLLLQARIPDKEKLEALYKIASCKYTWQLAGLHTLGMFLGKVTDLQATRRKIFANIINWMLQVKEVPDNTITDYCKAGEFFSAAAELPDEWISFKKLSVKNLLSKKDYKTAKEKISELLELLPEDKEVLDLWNQMKA